MDWLAELNATIELDSWFEIQAYEARELRDFILEKDAEIERLREALVGLMKVQNGPPLTAWTNDWNEAMKKADAALQQKESE